MSREAIYYWKCDRPSAFTTPPGRDRARIARQLLAALRDRLDDTTIELTPFDAPGNHLAWCFRHEGGERTSFVRVEDGPEGDDHLSVESYLLDAVRQVGVPTPRPIAVDTSRSVTPFAWQAIEWIDDPSLDHRHRAGTLDLPAILGQLGEMLGSLRQVSVTGFGPFRPEALQEEVALQGHHAHYRDYFFLNLDQHLDGLVRGEFLKVEMRDRIFDVMEECQDFLTGFRPSLVHKDTALWNLLGKPDQITAMIDWDDAIGGDPVDDLALIGCFFPRDQVDLAVEGYTRVAPLGDEFEVRYALHLLRNLIYKALIRLRSGIFDLAGASFLIAPGTTGQSLRMETMQRIENALAQLEAAIC